ncbi:hypothetical protein JCM10449v2_007264 [Rhodotorula kratochvilovae]
MKPHALAPPPHQPAPGYDALAQAQPPQGYAFAASPGHPGMQQSAPPLEFHVYKDARLFGKDDIITGPDKQQMLYYLHFPLRFFSGRWDLSLRRGGPSGPEVCKIEKGHFGDSFEIIFANGPTQPCVRTGFFNTKYEFAGAGNTAYYCWKADGYWLQQYNYSLYRSDDLKLPKEQRQVLAQWRTPRFTVSKDGTLTISPY